MYQNIVNEVLLSIGKQQNPMIDASEFLMRKGHDTLEVKRLACEFGRSLKIAGQRTGRADAVTNRHEFGGGSNDVRMYHAHFDATFLEAAYSDFQKRELYQRVCVARGDAQTHLAMQVVEAMQNSKGSAVPRERSLRRQRAV